MRYYAFISVFMLLVVCGNSALGRELSNELFKIRPYSLVRENSDNQLKFILNQNLEMELTVKNGNVQKRLIGNYEKDVLYNFNLGARNCQTKVSYSLRDTVTNDLIASNQLEAFSCDADQEIVFGLMSDTQDKIIEHAKISRMIGTMLVNPLSFIINAGDVVQKGGKEEQWVKFFDVGKDYSTKIPLIVAIGNHAYKGYKGRNPKVAVPPVFGKYMRWPEDKSLGQLYLPFPQFSLIVINSNFKQMSKGQQNQQWNWLKQKLERTRKEGKYVIVALHHATFSSSVDYWRKIARTLRKKMRPMLEKSGNVKMVLSGHTHMYERSYKSGIHYVIAGPAAGKKNIKSWKNKFRRYFNRNARTFSIIRASRKRISLITWDQHKKIIDKLEIPLAK